MRLRSLLIGALLAGSVNAELPSETRKRPAIGDPPCARVEALGMGERLRVSAHVRRDGLFGRWRQRAATWVRSAPDLASSHLLLSRDGKLIYSPETYFSRGTRGKRTDVVTLYDPATLVGRRGEIAIPPRRSSNLPMIRQQRADGRRSVSFDLQLQSVADRSAVVDTKTRKFRT